MIPHLFWDFAAFVGLLVLSTSVFLFVWFAGRMCIEVYRDRRDERGPTWRDAKGALPAQPGEPPSEQLIRRGRGDL